MLITAQQRINFILIFSVIKYFIQSSGNTFKNSQTQNWSWKHVLALTKTARESVFANWMTSTNGSQEKYIHLKNSYEAEYLIKNAVKIKKQVLISS